MLRTALLLFLLLPGVGIIPALAASSDTAGGAYYLPPPGRGWTRGSGLGEASFQNIFKINVLSLVAKSLSLQYEYSINPRMSACLGARISPKTTIPFGATVRDVFLGSAAKADAAATDDFVKHAKQSGWSVTPEYRYYFGRKPQQGLYLAAFARYSRLRMDWDYTFHEKDKNRDRPTVSEIHVNTIGLGLMAGAQWQLGKLALDWWIAGISYNSAHMDGTAYSDLRDRSAADNAATKRDAEAVTVYGSHPEVTVTGEGATASGTAGLPLIRFGLCIGYGF